MVNEAVFICIILEFAPANFNIQEILGFHSHSDYRWPCPFYTLFHEGGWTFKKGYLLSLNAQLRMALHAMLEKIAFLRLSSKTPSTIPGFQ